MNNLVPFAEKFIRGVPILGRTFGNIIDKNVKTRVERQIKESLSRRDTQDVIKSAILYDIESYNNWQRSLYDPNPIHNNPEFNGLKTFANMDTDTSILSKFNQRKDTCINRPWYVLPAIENDRNELIKAGFARYCALRVRNLNQKKKGIKSDMDFGYSVSEKILTVEDVKFTINLRISKKKRSNELITIPNAIVVRDIDNVVPSAFWFDNQRNIWYGSSQMNSRKLTELEKYNLIRSTFDPRFGSPYGWSLKTAIFPHYIMKKAILAWRLLFLEKFGIPTPIGIHPPEYQPNDPRLQEFYKSLDSLMHSAKIMVPQGFEVKFLEVLSKGGTMDMFQNALNYIDQCIAELVLGHKQATEATSVGSLASSTVKEAALRQAILETDAMNLDTVMDEQFIEYVIDLNFPSNGFYPVHLTYVEADKNIAERRNTFKEALAMNVDISQTQVRRDLHVDAPLDEFDAIEPADIVKVLQYQGVGSQKPKNPNGKDSVKMSKMERRRLRKAVLKDFERKYSSREIA